MTRRLRDLPPDQAAALLLAARPGMTYREVAARLGQDPADVRRQLTASLRALRPASSVPHEVPTPA